MAALTYRALPESRAGSSTERTAAFQRRHDGDDADSTRESPPHRREQSPSEKAPFTRSSLRTPSPAGVPREEVRSKSYPGSSEKGLALPSGQAGALGRSQALNAGALRAVGRGWSPAGKYLPTPRYPGMPQPQNTPSRTWPFFAGLPRPMMFVGFTDVFSGSGAPLFFLPSWCTLWSFFSASPPFTAA
jgi:hypothetical protein